MLLRRPGTEEPARALPTPSLKRPPEEETSLPLLGWEEQEGKKIEQLTSSWVATWDSEPGVLPPTQPPAPTAAQASCRPLHLLNTVELEEIYKKWKEESASGWA